MAHPLCGNLKKSYSIGRKRVVSWQLRRWWCPFVVKGFKFSCIAKTRDSGCGG